MTNDAELDLQVTQAPNTEEAGHADDPKRHPDPNSNAEKDPEDWVTGGEPMTGAQGSYLKTLSEQAHQPEMFEAGLSKAEASKRIDALKQKLRL